MPHWVLVIDIFNLNQFIVISVKVEALGFWHVVIYCNNKLQDP